MESYPAVDRMFQSDTGTKTYTIHFIFIQKDINDDVVFENNYAPSLLGEYDLMAGGPLQHDCWSSAVTHTVTVDSSSTAAWSENWLKFGPVQIIRNHTTLRRRLRAPHRH